MPSQGTATRSRYNPALAGMISQGSRSRTRLILDPSQNIAVLVPYAADRIATEFKKHEKRWLAQTRHVSSPVDKYLHPSYARIIGLGWAVVPYILKSLKHQPNDWFYALRAVTGENPVPASAAGNVTRMANVWIAWGEAKGLI